MQQSTKTRQLLGMKDILGNESLNPKDALQCLVQCEYLRVKCVFILLKGIWLDKVNFTFQVLLTMSVDIFDWHHLGNMYY